MYIQYDLRVYEGIFNNCRVLCYSYMYVTSRCIADEILQIDCNDFHHSMAGNENPIDGQLGKIKRI